MQVPPIGRTIDDVTHHRAAVNATNLHFVSAGLAGSPILLVHGFPESWWSFNKVIPRLAKHHRVFAVDLRGFGDSDAAAADDEGATLSKDLHALIAHLGVGPVHMLVQDISGTLGFRLASEHPDDLRSLIAVESVISGFGLEALADVANGGAWYFGLLATQGAAQVFLSGRERRFIGDFILPSAIVAGGTMAPEDLSELARGFERPDGWSGAAALYAAVLKEGERVRGMAQRNPLTVPLLAIDQGGSAFTRHSFGAVHSGAIESANIDGAGHYIALEAPDRLAEAVAAFVARCDRAADDA